MFVFITIQYHLLIYIYIFCCSDDDHEFKNDVALESDPELDGLIAWISYAGGANPQPLTVGAQYYNFTIGNTAYFVLDTRAFRSPKNQKDSPRKTMLGLTQKQKLFQWLQDTKGQFVFRVCLIIFI